VSAQIRSLERSLGQKLFDRQGRHLRLTSEGEKVFRYADEIFALGRELLQTVKGEPQAAPKKFRVGVSDALPKLTTYRLLEPALAMQPAFRLHVRIDKTERLLAELAVHAVDLVVADAPMMPSLKVRAFSHLLGETTVSIFGAAALAREVRRKFPGSLHGAPMLLQTTNTALRQSLDQWFDVHGIQPRVVVEDMAMLQTLGEHGLGLFAAPTVVRREICRRYKVAWVGELDRVRERFYGISVERRITHPAVRLIADQAKRRLFT
jgi:LysR family transcriptional activator of nhaA